MEYSYRNGRLNRWFATFGKTVKYGVWLWPLFFTLAAPVSAADNATTPTPALSLRVIDSQQVDYGTYSIFYNRVEPPILKPKTIAPPALPSLTIAAPTAAELEAIRKTEAQTQAVIMADVTVYDGNTTILRWWQDGGEYVYRSNINFFYLRSLYSFETEKTSYFVMLAVSDGGPLPASLSFGQIDNGSRFALISQPKTGVKPEAAQFMRDICAYYETHQTELIAAYQQSETARIAKEQWDRDHPPQPQNVIIQYFPIRSNFDALKGAAK